MNKKELVKIIKENKKISVGIGVLLVITIFLMVHYRENLALLQTNLVVGKYSLVSNEKMKVMKEKGCVYDGLLTPRYNQQFNQSVEMLKRSGCKYIHRSVETWNIPPDFKEIKRRMDVIKKETGKDFIYSMFIAESIDTTKGYYDPIEKKHYNFSAMCSPGTFGAWGENTCKPSFEKLEYRKYINSITRRAIDLGIEDFTFGQIYYQDPRWEKNATLSRSIVFKIKEYAKLKGVDISVGAQSNTMDSEVYLRNFDYITGGIGQHKDGTIETGHPCWSYYFERDGYCWALLWDKKYKSKANNVLVYLDWNNSSSDDIHRFIRMDRDDRRVFLGKAYDFFLWRNVGFLSPLGVVLGHVGGRCHGATSEFYSASNQYSCKDEDAINDVLDGKKPLPIHTKFISQNVPVKMEAGEKSVVNIKIKNTGFRTWSKENNFKLGSFAPQDNNIWGLSRVALLSNEVIGNNEIKEFNFNITAPQEVGEYNFQWKMLVEGEGWVGKPTDGITIEVVEANSSNADTEEYSESIPVVDVTGGSVLESIEKEFTSTEVDEGGIIKELFTNIFRKNE